jgi:hypothetical protein
MNKVKELEGPLSTSQWDDLLLNNQPTVIRGLVGDWPIVEAYKRSPLEFLNYLRQFNSGMRVDTLLGPPTISGRFFYNEQVTGFNYERKLERFDVVLTALAELCSLVPVPAIAIQGLELKQDLAKVAEQNQLAFMDKSIIPRLWLGNKVVTSTHYDTMDNIACAVAGKRHIVLFPPEQLANLYVGPLLLTPAGTPMSMVDLRKPDFDKYPRFTEALEAAQEVILAPGDALLIPSYWWHNVESMDAISGLINFWWKSFEVDELSPYQSLLHSLLSMQNLPMRHRLVWKNLFDHYVFQSNGHPGAHLPTELEDILTSLPKKRKENLMKLLAEQLAGER